MTVKKAIERIRILRQAEEWLQVTHTNEEAKCSFGKPNDEYFKPIVLDLIRHEYWRLEECEVKENA